MNNFTNQFGNQYTDFPVGSLTPLMRNAVYDIVARFQVPFSLAAMSVIGLANTAEQFLVDVDRGNGVIRPISLYLITLAESGERKTSVFNDASRGMQSAIREISAIWGEAAKERKMLLETLAVEKRGLLKAIEKCARTGKDSQHLKHKLSQLYKDTPPEQRLPRILFQDATPQSILKILTRSCPTGGLVSDEAGTLLNGRTFADLPALNALWDGAPPIVDRSSDDNDEPKGWRVRFSMSLMIQPGVFEKFMQKRGSSAHDVGLLARALITTSVSTQGTRFNNSNGVSREGRNSFEERLNFLTKLTLQRAQQNESDRTILQLDEVAKHELSIFNYQIEQSIGLGGYLHPYRAFASKAAENALRLAATLHKFESDAAVIDVRCMLGAIAIMNYFLQQHCWHFGALNPAWIAEQDGKMLYQWLCARGSQKGTAEFSRSEILQYGPSQLRSRERLDPAIGFLVISGYVFWILNSKGRLRVPGLDSCFQQYVPQVMQQVSHLQA